ncbi:IS3 family transposase [Lentibacillus cibarius]|uniref:IS3 family transposase n=1 Tax=Lentibacillus cibarius TaxID=2583219 RepID=A0A5S3QIE4_9BACI|nr:IS3 family transposase [Lentibacillus cibarius]TMN21690.1 IS3 family transposase [Lentibacillus cibarius]
MRGEVFKKVIGSPKEVRRKQAEFEFIREYEGVYPIAKLVGVTSVSRSGYYRWKSRKESYEQDKKDEELYQKILEIYRKHGGTFGRERIKKEFKRSYHMIVNEKCISRVMKKYGLRCQIRRKRKKGGRQPYGNIPNVLDRDFKALRPGIKMGVDITYVPVKGSHHPWLYVCAIKDLFNSEIVAYSMDTNQSTELVYEALNKLQKRGFEKGAILHSDQGIQFTNPGYKLRLKEMGITQSMSRRGNCWDNACVENFFSHFKTEAPCFYKMETLVDIKNAIDAYMHYFNNNRLQNKLEMSPVEYRLKTA